MAPSALLLASALLLLSGPYLATAVDVRDMFGDPIQAGGAYNLLPRAPGGGGVTLAGQDPARPGACPDKLALTGTPSDTGIPVRLSPQSPSPAKTVVVGAALRAQFGVLFRCIPTTWWAVQPPTTAGGPAYLVPGRKDGTFDWFRVGFDQAANAYFLQYCKGKAACQEVGVRMQGSDQFLVLGGVKFRFVFQKYGPGAAVGGQSQAKRPLE